MLQAQLMALIANGENSGLAFKRDDLRRKIVPLTRGFCGRDAVFQLTDDTLRVVLPARALP